MSYILDALKRAERERRAGSASLLDELPSTPNAAPAPAWTRWLPLVAVSALLAAGLTWFALKPATAPSPATTAVTATPVTPPTTTAPVTATPAATAPSVARPALDPGATSDGHAQAVPDDGRIASLDDLQSEEAPPPVPKSRGATPGNAASTTAAPRSNRASPGEPPKPRLVHPAPSPSESGDETATPDAAPASAAPESEASSSMAAPIESPIAATPDATPSDASAPDSRGLREMSDSYRASFPNITVDVHAYSEDAAQRFVLIGGHRYREGDSLPQGPRIAAIVPEGIVFDWKGERVLYPNAR